MIFSCVIITALGLSVEPEVYCKKAIWSGFGKSRRMAFDGFSCSISSTKSHFMPFGKESSPNHFCKFANVLRFVMPNEIPASLMMFFNFSRPRFFVGSGAGTAIACAYKQPKNPLIKEMPCGKRIKTVESFARYRGNLSASA